MAAICSTVLFASPAVAAQGVSPSCSGSIVHQAGLWLPGGNQVGRVELWYSSANGGTNCVITRSFLGSKTDGIGAYLWLQDGRNVFDSSASYNSYAGGAWISNAAGVCVKYKGEVVLNGDVATGGRPGSWGNCG
ncbi:hypothetical protein ACFQHV_13735 [Promicromonospora thailandica]|nr:hypothetical protein [Promicromonospora thailandica]